MEYNPDIEGSELHHALLVLEEEKGGPQLTSMYYNHSFFFLGIICANTNPCRQGRGKFSDVPSIIVFQ